MTSTLASGSSGSGSSPSQDHYVVFFSQCLSPPRSINGYKLLGQPKKMLGDGGRAGIGLASHLGGVAILLVGFMLRKPLQQTHAVGADLGPERLYQASDIYSTGLGQWLKAYNIHLNQHL